MLIRRPSDIQPSEITDRTIYLTSRIREARIDFGNRGPHGTVVAATGAGRAEAGRLAGQTDITKPLINATVLAGAVEL